MVAKAELQARLKERYGINKNISQDLSDVECQRLVTLLDSESSALKLVDAFIAKNRELTTNNQQYGKQRRQAEDRYAIAQAQYESLQESIANLENSNDGLVQLKQELEAQAQREMTDLEQKKVALAAQKQQLEKDAKLLEQQVATLQTRSQNLEQQVQALGAEKQELAKANHELQKDNKRLKNIVDAIRLKFSKDVDQLLKYEDSEIRVMLAKLYRSTLG
jgi:chromosome segregation ATPase